MTSLFILKPAIKWLRYPDFMNFRFVAGTKKCTDAKTSYFPNHSCSLPQKQGQSQGGGRRTFLLHFLSICQSYVVQDLINRPQSPPAFQSTCKVVVRKEPLVQDATMDFPRINSNFMGRENHYFYALGNEYLHPNRVSRGGTHFPVFAFDGKK